MISLISDKKKSGASCRLGQEMPRLFFMSDIAAAIEDVVEEAADEAAAEVADVLDREAPPAEPAAVVVVDEPTPNEEALEAIAFAEAVRGIAREEAALAVGIHEATYPHSAVTLEDVVEVAEEVAPEPEPEPAPPPREESPKNDHWLTRKWGKG